MPTQMIISFVLTILVSAILASANPWTPQARIQVWWLKRHYALVNQTQQLGSKIEVILLGDSLTDYWSSEGKPIWQQHFQPRNCFNYAINGDRSEHQLWRLTNGELDGLAAKLAVLMIGTNNVVNGDNATAITSGIETTVQLIQTKVPTTKVLVLSILPSDTIQFDIKIDAINKMVPALADNQKVFYLDLADYFETSIGHEVADLYLDQFDLSVKGYPNVVRSNGAHFRVLDCLDKTVCPLTD